MIFTTKQQEEDWRQMLDRLGEAAVRADMQLRNGVSIGFNDEARRMVAAEWLREKEQERERRERLTFSFIKWTLIAAIAAVVIGVAGIAVTLLANR